MAEKIVSPGVFTTENDLSFLPTGISEIGAAVIGSTVKGPAFVPTIVESYDEFVQKFGPSDPKTYVPYTVREYLASSGRVTIVRVLGQSGYSLDYGPICIQLSGSASVVASGSVQATGSANIADGDYFYVTGSGGTKYTFRCMDTPLPANASPIFYFVSASAVGAGAALTTFKSMSAAINDAAIGVTTTVPSVGSTLQVTASDGGTAGNSLGFNVGGHANQVTIEGGTDAAGGEIVNILHPTYVITSGNDVDLFGSATGISSNSTISNGAGTGVFTLTITGSYAVDSTDAFTGNANPVNGTTFSCSVDPNGNTYLGNVFGYNADGTQAVYNYMYFKNAASRSLSINSSAESVINIAASAWDFGSTYSTANTPWVTSQKINGTTKYNLFRAHTMAHGTSTNFETKIGISNVKPAGSVAGIDYGTFTLVVRAVDQDFFIGSGGTPYKYDDSDTKPNVLETFSNLTLDPDSANYVKRRIGDQYLTVDSEGKVTVNGDYPNKSSYIRIEVDTAVDNKATSANLVPFGFRSIWEPIPSSLGTRIPSASMIVEQKINDVYNKKKYFGFDYDFTNTDNHNYLKPLPNVSYSTGSNKDFYLGDYSQDSSANYPNATSPYSSTINLTTTQTSANTRKFMMPFQGGYDGQKPHLQKRTGTYITTTNTQGFDCSTVSTAGTTDYFKAINAVSNPDEYDINMIVTPGILYQYHPSVNIKAKDVCEDRGDAFYVMDNNILTANIATTTDNISALDSNYTATYYPWVKIMDTDLNKPMWVPPSVVLPGVIAYTDRVSHEWFAPAGLNRGGLTSVISTYTKLTHDERDDLYEGRVNPIASFPGQGVVVWGQKTLQGKASALDRINVRRLLIAVKKFIASSSRYLVFEQNTTATRNRFLNIVNPYLESIQQRQGLYSFKVVMDETNNTPDVIDRNILKGDIYLQPTKTAEFIVLDFNVLPTGATFPE